MIFSGEPTWAGYVKLDDTATWMGLTDHAFEFGRRTTGFPASTWEGRIAVYAGNGYPIGSFVPMALIGKVVGQDLAWTVLVPSMALHGLRICMGPRELLDWLYLWEGEYEEICESVFNFAQGVVRRYCWQGPSLGSARLTVPSPLDLSEEQRLKLTGADAPVHSPVLVPPTAAIVSFDQPWQILAAVS